MGLIETGEGFKLVWDERGITGTRRFIDGGDYGDAELPMIGDPFEDTLGGTQAAGTYDNVYCRRKEKQPFAGDPRKVEYLCHYSNDPTDKSQYEGGASNWKDLPMSAEFAGEYNLIDDPSGWTYDDSNPDLAGKPVEVPIPYRVQTCTTKITRIVAEGSYDGFVNTANQMLGKVNQGSGPPAEDNVGMWMFTSYTSEPFRNHNDERAWRAELIFTRRAPDTQSESYDSDGWQKILDKSGVFAIPLDKNSKKLYPEADFNKLFE